MTESEQSLQRIQKAILTISESPSIHTPDKRRLLDKLYKTEDELKDEIKEQKKEN